MPTPAHELRPFGLLACDVFRDEIETLGAPDIVEYLPMGLHDQPGELRRQINEAVLRLEKQADLRAIVLAYALCGNGLVGVRANRLPLVLPRAHDCIAIMLGGMAAFRRVVTRDPAIYFYSPGWVRERRVPGPDREAHIRQLYAERYPDDAEMIEDLVEADYETFGHYGCAGYVDLTGNLNAEAYSRRCADCMGWRFRKLEGDPAMLGDLLKGLWDEQRFLIVEPGMQIVAQEGDLVVDARPSEELRE